jgi:uncharacterized protein (DUF924 family)
MAIYLSDRAPEGAMSHSIEDILEFWFGEMNGDSFDSGQVALWFGGAEETDRRIREKFGEDLKRAIRGELDDWAETPRGRLALIILLDQFSRNIYRDTPQEVAQDAKALALAVEGMEKKMDRSLRPIERVFFYLPLEHSESLEMQNKSVKAFEGLVGGLPPPLRENYEIFLDYAVSHRKIIERFGRFPYQNEIMGRASTPEEIEFMNLPGAPFFL